MEATPERRTAGPANAAWDADRAEITELYVERNWSLPMVREHMLRLHRFKASRRMYKTRIEHWGLNQKRMTRERAMEGFIRFRTHSLQSTPQEQQGELRRLLSYYNRISKTDQMRLLREVEDRTSWQNMDVVAALASPAEYQLLEESMHLLQSYIQGCSQNLLWPRDPVNGFANMGDVPIWCSSIMSAQWVSSEGKKAEAARLISRFLSQCHVQLQRQDPLLFGFIYSSVLIFAKTSPGLAWRIIDAICTASERLAWAGSAHPLRLLLLRLRRLGPALMHAYADRFLPANVQLIQSTLGGPYPIVQDMTSDLMHRLIVYGSSPAAVADMGRRIISEAAAHNQQDTPYYLNVLLQTCDANRRTGAFREARQIAMSVLADDKVDFPGAGIRMRANMSLCRTLEDEGRLQDAFRYARTAITESQNHFGQVSNWYTQTLIIYRRLLTRAGKVDEAEAVQKQFDKAVRQLEDKLETEAEIEAAGGG